MLSSSQTFLFETCNKTTGTFKTVVCVTPRLEDRLVQSHAAGYPVLQSHRL